MMISTALKSEELPLFRSFYPNHKKLRDYFRDLLSLYDPERDPCLFLPSFPELAKQLDCAPLDLHCALQELRRCGYDYFSLSLHSPITLWHPSNRHLTRPCQAM